MQPSAPATTSAQALGNLQSFQGQMKAPTDFYNQAAGNLGVPQQAQQVSGLRQAITNTTNLLNGVAPSVMGRTQNSLVTSAQANRQIANEQAPINTQLNKEQTDYSGANADLSRSLAEAGTQAGLAEQGQAAQLQALQSVYNDLSTKEQQALSNQLEQQKIGLQAQSLNQNNAFQNWLNGQMNQGNNTTSGAGGGLPAGMTMKSTGNGGKGFNFVFGNSPVSAATFAKMNGANIEDLLYTMANNGDQYSAQAYKDIVNNKGVISPALMNKYSSLFWGEIPTQQGGGSNTSFVSNLVNNPQAANTQATNFLSGLGGDFMAGLGSLGNSLRPANPTAQFKQQFPKGLK